MLQHPSLRRLAWIALILFVWWGATDYALGQEKTPSTPSTGTPDQGQGTSTGLTKGIGRPLLGDRGPDFKLKAYGSDEEFHLSSLRGKESVVLVFVHRREGNLTTYDELATKLEENQVKMVFICRQGATEEKLENTGVPVLCDRWGDVAKSYGALNLVSRDMIPSIVVLDREGFVRFYIAGYMPTADALGETVLAVLKPYEEEGA